MLCDLSVKLFPGLSDEQASPLGFSYIHLLTHKAQALPFPGLELRACFKKSSVRVNARKQFAVLSHPRYLPKCSSQNSKNPPVGTCWTPEGNLWYGDDRASDTTLGGNLLLWISMHPEAPPLVRRRAVILQNDPLTSPPAPNPFCM